MMILGCTCQSSKRYCSRNGRSAMYCVLWSPCLISLFLQQDAINKGSVSFQDSVLPRVAVSMFSRPEPESSLSPGFVVLCTLHNPELTSLGIGNWQAVFTWTATNVERKWKNLKLIVQINSNTNVLQNKGWQNPENLEKDNLEECNQFVSSFSDFSCFHHQEIEVDFVLQWSSCIEFCIRQYHTCNLKWK